MFRFATRKCILGCGLALVFFVRLGDFGAQGGETVLHAFKGGSDGATPMASLVVDKKGRLFGTTSAGGGTGCYGGFGCGTVFRITPDGRETVLYAFKGGSDGALPLANLIVDKNGNFFGSTASGGDTNCDAPYGCGVVFELSPDGIETVLHTFMGGDDGALPYGGVIADNDGNLYGLTLVGGSTDSCGGSNQNGCGTLFKIAPNGTESILHVFAGGSDGGWPYGNLVRDKDGNLYGTTGLGGDANCEADGCGTVFKLASDGTETLLHVFEGYCVDGSFPAAGLIADRNGNLYGTTAYGGSADCRKKGSGTVFEVTPKGTEKELYSFVERQTEGANPLAGLLADTAGNLYGTTWGGGSRYGTAFQLAPDGTETILHLFTGHSDGAHPYATLIADAKGTIYGTTQGGGGHKGCDGDSCGTVFAISPTPPREHKSLVSAQTVETRHIKEH